VLPVADATLAESEGPAGVLALVLDFALGDDDGLCVGLDEDLAAAVDTGPCPGAGLVQLGLGVGWSLFLADPVELGLALLLALDDVVGVTDGEPPGLALGVSLGLTLALPDGLELALAVPPLLVLPLEDVAGAVVVAVVLLGGLLLVGVTDGCVDGDAQALSEGRTTTAGLLDGAPPATEGAGVTPEAAVLALFDGLLMLKAEPMASPTWANPWRAAGTTDRTTPTANTAAPMAKAGLSTASRQSLGRCEGRRSGACRGDPRTRIGSSGRELRLSISTNETRSTTDKASDASTCTSPQCDTPSDPVAALDRP